MDISPFSKIEKRRKDFAYYSITQRNGECSWIQRISPIHRSSPTTDRLPFFCGITALVVLPPISLFLSSLIDSVLIQTVLSEPSICTLSTYVHNCVAHPPLCSLCIDVNPPCRATYLSSSNYSRAPLRMQSTEEVAFAAGTGDGDGQVPAIYAEMEAQKKAHERKEEADQAAAYEARLSKMPPREVERPDDAQPNVDGAKSFGKKFYSFGSATREASGAKTAAGEQDDNWTVGFDVTEATMVERKVARGARFGTAVTTAEPVVADGDSAAADTEAGKKKKDDTRLPRKVNVNPTQPNGEARPEALHIFGTDSMSTKDIIAIFSAYIPSHLEWINDSSCNVVWKEGDDFSVKRVLSSLGQEIGVGALMPSSRRSVRETKKKASIEKSFEAYTRDRDAPPKAGTSPAADADADSNADAGADDDDGDDGKEERGSAARADAAQDDAASAGAAAAAAQDDAASAGAAAAASAEQVPAREPTEEETEALALWRRMVAQGRPLMIRQATVFDVKVRGAARKSQYYQKHGGRSGAATGRGGRSSRGRGRGGGAVVVTRVARQQEGGGGSGGGGLEAARWGHEAHTQQLKRAYKSIDTIGPHGVKEEGGGVAVRLEHTPCLPALNVL